MNTIDLYISEAPSGQRDSLAKIRNILRDTLIPLGYEECMSYGSIGYVIPFSLYPLGYHCDPSLPVPFANIASRKSGINLTFCGISLDPDLLSWCQMEYAKRDIGKLDMGVGCIRFKKLDTIPYDLIAELASKTSATRYLELYEKAYGDKRRK